MLREPPPGTIWFGVSMRFTEVETGNTVANLEAILDEMRLIARRSNARANIEGMKRFGILAEQPIGLTTPQLRAIAREIGRDQPLAEAFWATGIHDRANFSRTHWRSP